MPLYPCVPNQKSSTAEKAVKPSGSPVTDAVNVTVKSLSDLPTWVKVAGGIGLLLIFGDEIKRLFRRGR